MIKKTLIALALTLSTVASAQTSELTVANIAQDPMLAKWLSNSTLLMRNQLPEMIKNSFERAPIEEKQAIPSGAACINKMTDFLQKDRFTPAILKAFDASSMQEKRMDLPFVEFLHSDDGQKYMAQQIKATENFAKNIIDASEDDSTIENLSERYQQDSEVAQNIISKQINAKEINIGLFGLSLITKVTVDKVTPELMGPEFDKIKAEPECQAMQKESKAFEAAKGKK